MTWRQRRCAALVVLAVAGGVAPALAHVGGSTGHAAFAIDGATIRYTLTLWPATLPAPIAADLRRVVPGEAPPGILAALPEKVILVAGGGRCGAGTAAVESGAGESVIVRVAFTCPGPVRDLLVRDDLFDVLGADHHTLARIDAHGRTWQFVFSPEAREARVSVDAAGFRGVVGFVGLGVEHILTGYDHLLFLLCLLLPGGGIVALAKIITAFTVAHSVTLSLAVLDVVTLPERLIEAVIALSIAAVAAENLFRRATVTRRWIVSFGFGLVHGFGFSSALRELGLPAQGLLLSLFGFNAGVELGQALVVAVALPALVALRRTSYERRVIWSSSMAILLVGLALFVERMFL